MQFVSLLPYLLILPALAVGFSVGWLLRSSQSPERAKSDLPDAPDAEDIQKRIQKTEASLAESETELTHLNKTLAAARKTLAEREEEHRQLLNQLRERRTDMNDVAADLNSLEEEIKTKQGHIERTLTDMDKRTDQLNMLKELSENCQSDIDRLAQHVQWQDGEIARLRQIIKQRSCDITDVKALLAQREAELDRLIRLRRKIERDIRITAEQLRHAGRDSEKPTTTAQPIPIDDLTCLTDLTDAHACLLREDGIVNFAQIAQARPSELVAIIRISDGPLPDVRRWIAEAQHLIPRDDDDQNPFALPPPTSS